MIVKIGDRSAGTGLRLQSWEIHYEYGCECLVVSEILIKFSKELLILVSAISF